METDRVDDKGAAPVQSRISEVEDQKHGDITFAGGAETRRGIKSRHAQMIVIGGVIGTGFFVGMGQALATAGPAFLFVAYALISTLLFGIVTAITEVGAYLPVPGCSMAYYGSRFVSRSLGFAMGWMYWYTFAITVGYEITAASIVISYWPNDVPIAAWITVMLFVIVVLNFFPVKVYGESEFWFASLKVFTILGLLILSFILFWGGGPNRQRLGFWYWDDPGATSTYLVGGDGGRFCAFLFSVIFSIFSFNFGPELVILSAGEMQSPRKNLPRATTHFVIRLILFYVLGALAIGVICKSNAKELTNGGPGAAASPWVMAIKNAGISGLDSVVNAVIITAAWSAGNSQLYMSSRSLYSLAIAGQAPKIFARCNRWGVPYYAVGTSSLLALLAYLNIANTPGQVFDWLVNIINTAGFTSWICCCVIFLRFRKACAAQGVTDLPYKSATQPYMAWACLISLSLLLLLNGFEVFFPGNFSASSFLSAYIGIPIFLAFYAVHRVFNWKEPWVWKPEDVDLHTGLDEVLATQAADAEVEELGKPKWYKTSIKALWD